MADSNLTIGVTITGAGAAAAATQSMSTGLKAVQISAVSGAAAMLQLERASAALMAKQGSLGAALAKLADTQSRLTVGSKEYIAVGAQMQGVMNQQAAAATALDAQRRRALAAQEAAATALDAQQRRALAAQATTAQAEAKTATNAVAANAALNQSRTSTTNAGMGFLFLSQAIEDAQYGFGAVLNNIPLIVMSMKGSAGLAGALSIAGVAVNILVKHFDIFGTEAAKAAEKAGELADESKKLAGESLKEAKAHNENTAALDSQEKSLDQMNRAYDIAIQKSKDLRAAKDAETKANSDVADINSDIADAEIDDAMARGAFGEKEAARRHAVVAQERLDNAHKAAQENERAAKEEASTNKAYAEIKAKGLMEKATEKESSANGLFGSDADRKAAQDEGKKLSDEIDAVRAAMEASETKISRLKIARVVPAAAVAVQNEINEEVAKEPARLKQMEELKRKRDEVSKSLTYDRAAQSREGNQGKSRDELMKEAADLKQQSYDAAKEARQHQAAYDTADKAGDAETNLYGKKSTLLKLKSGTESGNFDRKAEEERQGSADQRNKEKWGDDEKNKEKVQGNARKEFGDVRKMAGTSGKAGEGMKQAEAALEQFLAGNKESGAIYAKLIKMFMEANKTNMEVQKEAKEALAAASATRSP